MIIVLTYDITNTSKRNKIIRILRAYGKRVQKSVFECDIIEKERLDIFSKIAKIMKESKENNNDSVRFYKICNKCLKKTNVIGKGIIEKRPSYLII